MKHIIIDTDPGVDDALAIMLAFSSPELKVEAVTTVSGNVSVEKGTLNALKLLEFLGVEGVPVCVGASKPLLREAHDASGFHGESGLRDAELPEPRMNADPRNAVEVILEKADELSDELILVPIGPLTNVAAAYLADPNLMGRIGGIVIMGGAFNLTPYGIGNANAVAEFNVWHDPEAAKIVFDSGTPIVAIGLDVTTDPKNRLNSDRFERIKALGNQRARLLEGLCGSSIERYGGVSVHDVLAVAYVIDPTMFGLEKHNIDVEVHGELTRGMTVVNRRHRSSRPANVDACVSVDAVRFHELFFRRVAQGSE
ncbi:MAG TPA: nucleoside hydrolase [Patescibacteria group bacterium]|nr:nucleoside hydrolase [Patescibacteria group bacterium]